MDAIDVLRTKRDGGALSADQIRWVIGAYTDGVIPDEQMSALLMAVYFRGLNPAETYALTDAMIRSGTMLDLSAALGRKVVDKHSTGGVGDKTSIAVGPIVAACGVPVGKMSGRGLGHTGGTLDKLESIPGWRADISNDEMFEILRDVGGVICAAGKGLAPADKRLYALRDITGTVEAIPLIASSIMSANSSTRDRAHDRAPAMSGRVVRVHSRARSLARTSGSGAPTVLSRPKSTMTSVPCCSSERSTPERGSHRPATDGAC